MRAFDHGKYNMRRCSTIKTLDFIKIIPANIRVNVVFHMSAYTIRCTIMIRMCKQTTFTLMIAIYYNMYLLQESRVSKFSSTKCQSYSDSFIKMFEPKRT